MNIQRVHLRIVTIQTAPRLDIFPICHRIKQHTALKLLGWAESSNVGSADGDISHRCQQWGKTSGLPLPLPLESSLFNFFQVFTRAPHRSVKSMRRASQWGSWAYPGRAGGKVELPGVDTGVKRPSEKAAAAVFTPIPPGAHSQLTCCQCWSRIVSTLLLYCSSPPTIQLILSWTDVMGRGSNWTPCPPSSSL